MDADPEHKIILDLNLAGFSGEDLEELKPDFLADRQVRFQFQWYPSVEGPDSYRIIIEIGVVLVALAGKSFLSELGKDLYRWAKAGLGNVFKRRHRGDGWLEIRFSDKVITIPAHPSTDDFADAFLELGTLLNQKNIPEAQRLVLLRDSAGRWSLRAE